MCAISTLYIVEDKLRKTWVHLTVNDVANYKYTHL